MRWLTEARLSRGRYLVAMIAVLSGFGAAAGALGLAYGLKTVLPAFLAVAALAVILRVLIAAARWRDGGLPGIAMAGLTTAALGLGFAVLPPSLALVALAIVVAIEAVLPTRRPALV